MPHRGAIPLTGRSFRMCMVPERGLYETASPVRSLPCVSAANSPLAALSMLIEQGMKSAFIPFSFAETYSETNMQLPKIASIERLPLET
jgi:hypothetical protein